MPTAYLAHHIIYRGKDYGLSVVELTDTPDGRYDVVIRPFEREEHSTVFHSGTIEVRDTPDGPKLIFR